MEAPNSSSKKSLEERLHAITALLPIFELDDFEFGRWNESPDSFPYFQFSDPANQFQQACYEARWILPDFYWGDWIQTEEAKALREDQDVLAQANVEDLEHLLTALIRSERFSEGTLNESFQSGLLNRILHRAAELESKLDEGEEILPDRQISSQTSALERLGHLGQGQEVNGCKRRLPRTTGLNAAKRGWHFGPRQTHSRQLQPR